MSRTKEQCLNIIVEKFDNTSTNLESKLLVVGKIIKEISNAEYGFLYAYDSKNNELKFLTDGVQSNIKIESSIVEEVLLTKKRFF